MGAFALYQPTGLFLSNVACSSGRCDAAIELWKSWDAAHAAIVRRGWLKQPLPRSMAAKIRGRQGSTTNRPWCRAMPETNSTGHRMPTRGGGSTDLPGRSTVTSRTASARMPTTTGSPSSDQLDHDDPRVNVGRGAAWHAEHQRAGRRAGRSAPCTLITPSRHDGAPGTRVTGTMIEDFAHQPALRSRTPRRAGAGSACRSCRLPHRSPRSLDPRAPGPDTDQLGHIEDRARRCRRPEWWRPKSAAPVRGTATIA